MLRLFIAVVAASWLLSAPSARAERGELAVSFGPGLWLGSTTVGDTEVLSLAPTASASIRYGLDDFWQLGGALAAGVALSGDHDPAFMGQACLEAHLFIDVVTWVLYATAGAGALIRQAHADAIAGLTTTPRADLSAHVGLGLDYRPSRAWSVGATLRYQLVITDLARTSPAADLALSYTLYFQ